MFNESLTEPHPEPQRPAPSNPSSSPDTAPEPPASGEADAGARTPDEYTEMPGSHRRGSDGAALDVGA